MRAFIHSNISVIAPKCFMKKVYKVWMIQNDIAFVNVMCSTCPHLKGSDWSKWIFLCHVTALLSPDSCAVQVYSWNREGKPKKIRQHCCFGRTWRDFTAPGRRETHKNINALWYYQRKPGAMFLARFKLFLTRRRNLPSSRCIITNNTGDFLF